MTRLTIFLIDELARPIWPMLAGVWDLALRCSVGGRPGASRTLSLRLLLVKSAAEAAQIHKQLDGGFDFGVLAREKSIDPTSIDGGLMGDVDPSHSARKCVMH